MRSLLEICMLYTSGSQLGPYRPLEGVPAFMMNGRGFVWWSTFLFFFNIIDFLKTLKRKFLKVLFKKFA